MVSTTLNGVTFLAPEKSSLAHLKSWYDDLEDSEVKRAIAKLRWRELKITKRQWIKIYAISRHPIRHQVASLKSAKENGMTADIESAALELLNSHQSWIESLEMPRLAYLDGHEIEVCWYPEELPPCDPDTLPPQQRAEHEIESNTQELLYLIHVATQSLDELVNSMVGTSTPFMSAGVIVYDVLESITHCPSDFADSQEERDQLHDRIREFPSDLIILLRLAEHVECEQPLVNRVSKAIVQFRKQYQSQIPIWLAEYNKREKKDEEDPDDRSHELQPMDSKTYLALDEAGEAFKESIIDAVIGHEPEMATVINEVLTALPNPKEPFDDDDY